MTTSLGEYFVNKCLEATTQTDPWPYAQFPDALPADSFDKLKKSIVNIDKDRLKEAHNKDADRKSFTRDDFPSFKSSLIQTVHGGKHTAIPIQVQWVSLPNG